LRGDAPRLSLATLSRQQASAQASRSTRRRRPAELGVAELARWLGSASTRLLVLQVDRRDQESEQACRVLAHALSSRGGPTVLVTRFPNGGSAARDFYDRFYTRLLADDQIDDCSASRR
jgi:hypothetical protein